MSKRNEHGELKVKAAKDLLDRICEALEKALKIPVISKFELIPSSAIVRFGRTNGKLTLIFPFLSDFANFDRFSNPISFV